MEIVDEDDIEELMQLNSEKAEKLGALICVPPSVLSTILLLLLLRAVAKKKLYALPKKRFWEIMGCPNYSREQEIPDIVELE